MAVVDLYMFQSEQILIPFLFVLAITFGSIEITKIFRNKAVNLLISISLAIFAVSNDSFVQLLWSQFGNISVFFIAMFFIVFIIKVFSGFGKKERQNIHDEIMIYGAILFALLVMSYLFIDLLPVIPVIGGGKDIMLIVFIFLMIAIFWATFKTTTPPRT
ncbi:hypothetical protein A3K64_01115 [Candidatus Micrarchaeota archaeon RBG_16_36_9]|nr:MAG: hypothetical protein A3K64_01115 [Candidatus Micrarchaeota archaeon RBG_16_36_9]